VTPGPLPLVVDDKCIHLDIGNAKPASDRETESG
jgi:hypothetical protein